MADRATISELAEAIADGLPVDWASVEAAASDDADRAAIERLKGVERLAGGLRSPGNPGASARGATAAGAGGDAASREPHAQWGHLTILEKIGEGAFGEVYRAHDPKLARDVALKLLRAPALSGENATAAIEEGRLLARIRHPNVVTVYGADRLDGRVGLWMEFLQGRTLEQDILERGPFEAHAAAQVGVELARALAAVHAAGFIHRDIKAQNVMRDHDGRLVLMDFGTGREHLRPTDGVGGDLTGTPLYVAPEVLQGGPATVRSDVYSFGVLLYHLVTGGYPTTAKTLKDLITAHRTQPRTSIALSRPDLPRGFVEVVERARASDPDRRYATAGEVEAALASVLRAADRSPRRWWLAGAAVLAAIAAGAAVLMVARPWSAPESTAEQWVLIAAFENRTGNPAVDGGAIEDVLERELTQTPYLKVATRARIDDALLQMREPPGARMNPAMAREVCLRDGGIHVLVTGHIDKVGETFSLTAELVNPADGGLIKKVSEQAPNQSALPAAIRREALALRKLLGEQADSIEASRLRLEHVTTPSMVALGLYSQGMTANLDGNPDHQDLALRERYFRAAIASDPGFAAAHLMLAVTIKAQRQNAEGEYTPVLDRAVELADSSLLTRLERDMVDGIAHYWRALHATGADQQTEARLAATALEAVLWVDPGNGLASSSLNSVDHMLGHKFDLVEIRARSVAVRPLDFAANASASAVSMREGRIKESERYYRTALRADPRSPNTWIRLFPANQAWAEGNVRLASIELDQAWAAAQDLSALDRARVAREIAEMLLTVGRAQASADVANAIPEDQPRLRIPALGRVLELRGDQNQLAAILRPHVDGPLAGLFADLWVSAGQVEQARRILAKRTGEDASINLHIACVQGRYGDADRSGQQYLAGLNGGRPSPRQIMMMAQALRQLDRPADAIKLLEPAAGVSPAVAIGTWPGYQWLQLRADLADLYRKTGRKPAAQEIEKDVLERLSVADADFPLLVELKRRSGS